MNDPMIEKYKRELLEFSRRYPKYSAPEPQLTEITEATEPETDDAAEETAPEPAERLVSAEQLYREDFVQTEPAVTAAMRLENVAQREQMPMSAPEPQPTEEPAAAAQRDTGEMEYAACDSTDPPYCNGTVDTFPTREAFLAANPAYGYLRVQASVAEQAYPVQNASVEISKTFSGQKNVFFTAQTDASGIVSRVTLPAPDRDLSSAPSALQPYATDDIFVSHPNFTDVYVPNCIVFATIETIQQVRMVPLASCDDDPDQPFCEEA